MTNTDLIAKQILNGMEKQAFYDWYNSGRFESYIASDIDGPSKKEITNDIIKLFHLDAGWIKELK